MSDAKRLRQIEEENRRLKHMVADQVLDIQNHVPYYCTDFGNQLTPPSAACAKGAP